MTGLKFYRWPKWPFDVLVPAFKSPSSLLLESLGVELSGRKGAFCLTFRPARGATIIEANLMALMWEIHGAIFASGISHNERKYILHISLAEEVFPEEEMERKYYRLLECLGIGPGENFTPEVKDYPFPEGRDPMAFENRIKQKLGQVECSTR